MVNKIIVKPSLLVNKIIVEPNPFSHKFQVLQSPEFIHTLVFTQAII